MLYYNFFSGISYSPRYNKFIYLYRSYKDAVCGIKDKPFSKRSLLSFVFFVSLNLIIPLWGFGIFLHSDANFMVVICSIIFSYQLYQIVFVKEG